MAAFAYDVSASGKITSLREWWSHLIESGPKYRYYLQPTTSWLILKQEKLEDARRAFDETGIQITVEGEQHLGVVIGNEEYKER